MYRFNAEDPDQSLYTSTTVGVIGVASRGPPSRAYRLRHVTIAIAKWFPKYGKLSWTSSFCPFGKVLRVLLAQIVLGSDYSVSLKVTSTSFEKR